MHILHKCRADCAGTCNELIEVPDDCRSQSDFVQVDTEDRLVVKERSDDLFRVLSLTEPDLFHDRADCVSQRIGRELEDFTVVVDARCTECPAIRTAKASGTR